MVDHRWMTGRSSGRGTRAEHSIAGLELGRWDQVCHRLLPRLVPRTWTSPLGFEPPLANGRRSSAVRFDVGIDVEGGIVRLDQGLIRSLAVSPAEIWRAAVSNLGGRDRPPIVVIPGDAISFALLAGGPWTTGLLLVPEQLDPVAAQAPSHGSGSEPVEGPAGSRPTIVAVAPHPEVLVLGLARTVAEPGGRGGPTDDALARATVTLATRLAESDGGPRLPLVPLRPVRSMHEVLSRAGGFWNDVPVSEQPGRR